MKNLRFLFVSFLMSCSAASYYSSPNKHFEQILQPSDSIFVYTRLSQIHVETSDDSQPRIRWVVPKKRLKDYQLTYQSDKNKTHVNDSVLTNNLLSNQVLVQLFIPAGTVLSVQNRQGNTFVNHSGKIAVSSDSGSTTIYQARDDFWVSSDSGNLSIGLADIFQHSGYIFSENGKVRIITGKVQEKLHITREEFTEQHHFQRFLRVESAPNLPYLFIASQDKLTEIVTASTLIW